MIKPAGIIQRIAREPSIHLEYLANDDPESPKWTPTRADAFFFKDYHDADGLAHKMGGRPIFAITQPGRGSVGDIIPAELEPTPQPRRVYRPRHRIPSAYPNLSQA